MAPISDQLVKKLHQHWEAGELRDAEILCVQLVEREANDAAAIQLLALTYQRQGRLGEALTLMRRSAGLSPAVADYSANLGGLLGQMSRLEEAERVLRAAVAAFPEHATAHLNLGAVLERRGDWASAKNEYEVVIMLRPDHAGAHAALGKVLYKQERFSKAVAAYRHALALAPDVATNHRGLALALQAMGDSASAVPHLRRAVALAPRDAHAHSALILVLNYIANDRNALLDAALSWTRAPFVEGVAVAARDGFSNDPSHERPLRIGYLSPDFRDHAVGRLIEPVLGTHDRASFHIFAYSDTRLVDDATTRMRSKADVWRDTAGLEDDQVERLIRGDGIDILVEAAGHFAGSRLPLLARRVAPVQVSGFGYCGTTGLATIDFRLTDPHSDPVGETDAFHTERLLRLPDCVNCYRPFGLSPDIGPLPASVVGHVTFGCLNNLAKLTDEAVECWCRILNAIQGARLMLLTSAQDEYTASRFARHGIGTNRLELVGKRPRYEYLRLHSQCDFALDTFPFNGDNTTLDALWMGVPTLTLAGDRFAARRGLSHMANLGLPEWVTHSPNEYVERAVTLSSNLIRLAELRATLRTRLIASPLGDVDRYTRNLQNAYRRMWVEWCNEKTTVASALHV